MAYVVRRPNNRWEVRETVRTERGPRSRSLATFAEFDEGVATRAQLAAHVPVDRAALLEAARRAGAPVAESRADAAVRVLLHEMSDGRQPSPGLAELARSRLAGEVSPTGLQAGDGIADWIGASPERRGDALRDLMALTDRLPPTRRTALHFPRFQPVETGA